MKSKVIHDGNSWNSSDFQNLIDEFLATINESQIISITQSSTEHRTVVVIVYREETKE